MNERKYKLQASLGALSLLGHRDYWAVPQSRGSAAAAITEDAHILAQYMVAEARKRGLFDEPAGVPFPRGDVTFKASGTIHNNHALALAELEAERLGHKVTERVLREDIDRLRDELEHNITMRKKACDQRNEARKMVRRLADALEYVADRTGWSQTTLDLAAEAKEFLND